MFTVILKQNLEAKKQLAKRQRRAALENFPKKKKKSLKKKKRNEVHCMSDHLHV